MNSTIRIVIVVSLIVAVAAVINLRSHQSGSRPLSDELRPEQLTGRGRPTLIDLGADTCIPCKLMAPVLGSLKTEFTGRLDVHFINLNQYPDAASVYHINVMPTQIFYDAAGKERFRHEGFFAKEDILAKWKEFGIELSTPK
jgi:thioredoxin 1